MGARNKQHNSKCFFKVIANKFKRLQFGRSNFSCLGTLLCVQLMAIWIIFAVFVALWLVTQAAAIKSNNIRGCLESERKIPEI